MVMFFCLLKRKFSLTLLACSGFLLWLSQSVIPDLTFQRLQHMTGKDRRIIIVTPFTAIYMQKIVSYCHLVSLRIRGYHEPFINRSFNVS